MPGPDELFSVGVLSSVHGLRGDMIARSDDVIDPLLSVTEVSVFRQGARVGTYRILRCSPHKGGALVRLEGVDGRDRAQELLGAEIRLPRRAFPPLKGGRHYWFELKGAPVVDRNRGEIGTIAGKMRTPAHPLYVVAGNGGDILIPDVPQFIVETLGEDGCMHVDLPEGLIELNHDL